MDTKDQLDGLPASRERAKPLASVFIDLIAKAYRDWGGFDPDSHQFDDGGDEVGRENGPEENDLGAHELGRPCAAKKNKV